MRTISEFTNEPQFGDYQLANIIISEGKRFGSES